VCLNVNSAYSVLLEKSAPLALGSRECMIRYVVYFGQLHIIQPLSSATVLYRKIKFYKVEWRLAAGLGFLIDGEAGMLPEGG
jgi:hypothetical protein